MSQALLKVTDLKKSYGAIRAVGGVSFQVYPGEIFGVIGPNGSGKTTLFNSMLGQITPDSGRIELNGQDVSGMGPLALNRLGVGRTFQTLQVFGKMTVRDNLIVAAQEHRGSMLSRMFAPGDSGLGAKADALIDQFRIRHVADKRAGELSYGQQKLVDIAMAFMSEPDLVLLDEPCAGVNPSLVGGISQLLKDGIIEADAINQIECFEAGVLFSRAEGIIPAPEANHAIAEVIRQAKQADEEGVSKTILFNLCGHGHFDLSSYEQFLAGKLVNYEVTQEQINSSLAELDTPVIA
mgnify:CR=1 FL=1